MGHCAPERGIVIELERLRRWQLERWISLIRLIAVPWAVAGVAFFRDYPSGAYESAAAVVPIPPWWTTAPQSGSSWRNGAKVQ